MTQTQIGKQSIAFAAIYAMPQRDISPLVSIVIPVYNGANFLAEAINSALLQSYKNIEILVINDGSEDYGETERIALSFGPKIRYFYKLNGGVASALNLAIQEMHGDYFSWLSHDDLYCDQKIEEQIKTHLSSLNTKIITYSNYSIFSNDLRNATPVHLKQIAQEKFRLWLTTTTSMHGCSLLIPTSALLEAGGFNEAALYTQDYQLWFKLAKEYQFIHIDKMLLSARTHSKQGTKARKENALEESDNLHCSFIQQLTIEELDSLKIGQPEKAYLLLAQNMWKRGFNKAGAYAQSQAYAHGAIRVKVLLAKAKSMSLYIVLKVLRHLLTPQLRLKMRNLTINR